MVEVLGLLDRIGLEHRVADAERVAEYWRREADRLAAANARRLAALKARRGRKLAPWWRLGCEQIDSSGLYYPDEMKLEDVPFKCRTFNCLKNAREGWRGRHREHEEPLACGTVGEMRKLNEAELLGLDNFGKVSLADFNRVIWMQRPE